MTDADIEAIARAYCAKLGLDPEIWLTVLRSEVREHLAMREAIAEVLGEKGVGL